MGYLRTRVITLSFSFELYIPSLSVMEPLRTQFLSPIQKKAGKMQHARDQI